MVAFLQKLFGPPIPSILPQEAQERLAVKGQRAPVLVDVRTPAEFKALHAPQAKLIPLQELAQRLKEVPADREVLVICASGNRSRSATRLLLQAGYNANNVQGGMNAWLRAGLPVKK